MLMLQYRLDEMDTPAQRAALFDDIRAHYKDADLSLFLSAVDALLNNFETTAIEEVRILEEEIESLTDDYSAAETARAELESDVSYWKNCAEIAEHDREVLQDKLTRLELEGRAAKA